LISVDEALARILDGAWPLDAEAVSIDAAAGRVLAADLLALRTQPPFDASAMDGYAVRGADVAAIPARLRLIGAAAAGHGFDGVVGPGEAVRIFTGAPLPAGADTVVLQENVTSEQEGWVTVTTVTATGRHRRAAGLDFRAGERGLAAGTVLDFRAVSLAAAMNHATVPAVRRPRVAIVSTGDELVAPGGDPGPDQIVASNHVGVAALVARAGGVPLMLGIAGDTLEALAGAVERAETARADILVTLGGASVGDHDLVQEALGAAGMQLDFWRIAMRPGKPLMSGRLGRMRVLGLPGNPVSSLVCGLLFLAPLVAALAGRPSGPPATEPALLGGGLPGNDNRRDHVRAKLVRRAGGMAIATPLPVQDSSMISALAEAGCLIIREPHAPPSAAGDLCLVIPL